MAKNYINIETRVDCPGKFAGGVVVRIRARTSRKIMAMAKGYTQEIRDAMEASAQSTVAEVQVGRALWTCSLASLKPVGSASAAEAAAAAREAARIKSAPSERRQVAASQSFDKFSSLKEGDDIEVEFRDAGWQPAKFVRINSGGRITYSRHGRERHSWPQFVRSNGGGK